MNSPYKAQFGEDRFLDDYFDHKRDGYYVEIGAFNGVKMSNTYFFEQQGWRGLLVEADPDLAEQCRSARPHSTVVNCAVVAPGSPAIVKFQISTDSKSLSSLSFDEARKKNLVLQTGDLRITEIEVQGRTLDDVLTEESVGRIDFLTIDVEGYEWAVLQGFSIERWRPEIVILERNTMFPDRRIVRYMFGHGYRYLRTRGVNDWFVLRDASAAETFGNLARFIATLYVRRPLRKLYHRLRRHRP